MKKLLIILMGLLLGCIDPQPFGFLLVEAPQKGIFELYKIVGDSTLQFVSIQVGKFNQKLKLSAGSYLVLGDCSHEMVIINPNELKKIVAHTVNFIPPKAPQPGDLFTVQCSRYEKTQSRQKLNNHFSFNMFGGKRDLLVGMRPFVVSLEGQKFQEKPQSILYHLAALQVTKLDSSKQPLFFVSPESEFLSITQAQEFGRWQFLLPGPYRVTVNGTSQFVDLKEGEAQILHSAQLKISSSEGLDMNAYRSIKGKPYTIETQDQHQFDINQTYPVLPGELKLLFDGFLKLTSIQIQPNQLTEIKMNSVIVKLDCGYWEWECLGKKEVMLFEKNQPYPFVESISDLPILYLGEGIEVGIEGGNGLRYQISEIKKDIVLNTGKVVMTPNPTYKPGFYTDLVRIQGGHSPFIGYSYDIPANKISTMTLIAGDYALVQYISSKNNEVRSLSKRNIHVQAESVEYLDFDFLLAEPKALSQAKNAVHSELKKLRKEKLSTMNMTKML